MYLNDINIEEYVKDVEYARENRKSIMTGVDMYLGELVDKLVDDAYEFDELYDRIHCVISDYADECVDVAWKHLCNAILNDSRRGHDNDKERAL